MYDHPAFELEACVIKAALLMSEGDMEARPMQR